MQSCDAHVLCVRTWPWLSSATSLRTGTWAARAVGLGGFDAYIGQAEVVPSDGGTQHIVDPLQVCGWLPPAAELRQRCDELVAAGEASSAASVQAATGTSISSAQ